MIGSDIQVTLSQCQSTWEIELVVRMVSCENRIKTKDLSLVLNGDLLRRETFIKGLFFLSWILVLVSVINMEKNSEKTQRQQQANYYLLYPQPIFHESFE